MIADFASMPERTQRLCLGKLWSGMESGVPLGKLRKNWSRSGRKRQMSRTLLLNAAKPARDTLIGRSKWGIFLA